MSSFAIVLGVAVMSGGMLLFLKEQMRQGLSVKADSLGKAQAMYLAEMGLNQAMFLANQDPDISATGTRPLPITPSTTNTLYWNMTELVGMTKGKNDANNYKAEVWVIPQSANRSPCKMQADAKLEVAGLVYTASLQFEATKLSGAGGQWCLTRYQMLDLVGTGK